MAIKPIDLRRKEFKNSLRGYDANQVDDFLDEVADEFERSFSENQRMREEISSLKSRLEQFEELEGAIREALVHAQQVARDLRQNANKEAELVVREAKEQAKAAPQATARRQAARAGVPLGVVRALAKKRTVVLFFRQRGSADDDATAQAVASQQGRPRVSVCSAPISRLADYRAIAGEAGVSQAPAVVVVGRKGARLVEGYVDSETLAQEVADSR